MYERYLSFAEYIRAYDLQRIEGLLLRHLSQVWKVLAQTVPEGAKTPEVAEMEDYFRELIRGVDSSLLEEWERLRNPSFTPAEGAEKPERPATFDVTRDASAFKRLVRTAIFGFLQDVATRDWESANERLRTGESKVLGEGEIASEEARSLSGAFSAYFEARERFRLDPEGRSSTRTFWGEDRESAEWRVSQVLVDPKERNDWEAHFVVSLIDSRAANRPVLRFEGVAPIGSH